MDKSRSHYYRTLRFIRKLCSSCLCWTFPGEYQFFDLTKLVLIYNLSLHIFKLIICFQVSWENKILLVGGHTKQKQSSEFITGEDNHRHLFHFLDECF